MTLGTEQEPVVVDTIVMANLGYLQLKSNPGRWYLKLREGRSSEIYDIVSHENTEGGQHGYDIQVLITSFKVGNTTCRLCIGGGRIFSLAIPS